MLRRKPSFQSAQIFDLTGAKSVSLGTQSQGKKYVKKNKLENYYT